MRSAPPIFKNAKYYKNKRSKREKKPYDERIPFRIKTEKQTAILSQAH